MPVLWYAVATSPHGMVMAGPGPRRGLAARRSNAPGTGRTRPARRAPGYGQGGDGPGAEVDASVFPRGGQGPDPPVATYRPASVQVLGERRRRAVRHAAQTLERQCEPGRRRQSLFQMEGEAVGRD